VMARRIHASSVADWEACGFTRERHSAATCRACGDCAALGWSLSKSTLSSARGLLGSSQPASSARRRNAAMLRRSNDPLRARRRSLSPWRMRATICRYGYIRKPLRSTNCSRRSGCVSRREASLTHTLAAAGAPSLPRAYEMSGQALTRVHARRTNYPSYLKPGTLIVKLIFAHTSRDKSAPGQQRS
jgi:hypothetical protein